MEALRRLPEAQWGLALLDAVPDPVALLDARGVIVLVNAAWSRFGLENSPGGDMLQAGPGIDYPALCDAARSPSAEGAAQAAAGIRAVLGGRETDFILDYPCPAPGRERWFRMRVLPLDVSGAAALVAHADITERMRADRLLHESESRYRAEIEDLSELICRFAVDGTILFANEVYCRFFGKRAGELVGRRWQPIAHSDDVARVESELGALTAGHPVVVIENRVFSGDGALRWMQFVNRGRFDADGRLLEIQAVGRDVTRQRALEDELKRLLEEKQQLGREVRRLQEKEREVMARELHDVLSPALVAIRAHAGAIERRSRDKGGATRRDAQAIDRAASDIYAISRRVMETLHPQELDGAGLVAAIAGLAEHWTRAVPGLRVRVRAATTGAESADTRIDLFRIVQECLANAIRHGKSRRIRVFVGERRAGSQRRLRLVVRDDGAGLPDGEPRGGYGLVLMRERARGLGGEFSLESRPGRGLRVAVDVPLPD